MMQKEKNNEQGLVLAIFMISIIISYVVLKLGLIINTWNVSEKLNSTITDAFYIFWGLLFLMCFLIPHKSFIFRFIIKIGFHLSNYKNIKYIIFIFSIVFLLIGILGIFKTIL